MKITKTQAGITLIALIITIVVLLILAVVTVGSVKNSGIIDRAQEAKILTEISQIKEAVELKKTEDILDAIVTNSDSDDFTINDLDIADNLKSKYGNKLTISDGVLYYIPDGVTDIEITYFKKIGINPLPQQQPDEPNEPDPNDSAFKTAVKTAVQNTTKTEDYYNLVTIKNAVKQEYPNAVGLVLADDYNGNPAELITEEGFQNFVGDETTILLSDGNEKLEVDINGNVSSYNGNVVLMNDLEAMNTFGLKRIETGKMELISYKGSNSTIEVPTALYNDTGDITEGITKISSSAFVKNTTQPTATSVIDYGIDSDMYNGMTINQLFSALQLPTYSGSNGTSTDPKDKLRALYETFLSGNLGSSASTTASMIYDENLIPSMYIEQDGSEINFLKRTTAIDITSVKLPVCTDTIDSNAFKDQTTLTSVTLPVGSAPTISSTAFSGCTGLTKIDFNTFSTVEADDITSIEGFSTRWGAPEGTKIYLNGTALN